MTTAFSAGSLPGDSFGGADGPERPPNPLREEIFASEMPALGGGVQEEAPKAEEKTVSEEESGRFAQIWPAQRPAPRKEEAPSTRTSERAAEIRDELRAMEGKDENKAS